MCSISMFYLQARVRVFNCGNKNEKEQCYSVLLPRQCHDDSYCAYFILLPFSDIKYCTVFEFSIFEMILNFLNFYEHTTFKLT